MRSFLDSSTCITISEFPIDDNCRETPNAVLLRLFGDLFIVYIENLNVT
jgi:hypothetical protein